MNMMSMGEREQKLDALIEVIRESDTFYMPIEQHECGTPACIQGHCEAYFGEDLHGYLGISFMQCIWLVDGHFSKKSWEYITQDDAITALEMVRDGRVPYDPLEPEVFTID